MVLEILLNKISFINRSDHSNTAVNLPVGLWQIMDNNTGEVGDAQ